MKRFEHEIKEVYPLKNYQICVIFLDGKTVIYDTKPVLTKHKVFDEVRNKKVFNHPKNLGFSVSWTKNADIGCEGIYKDGIEYKTPFASIISFKDATRFWKLSESTLRKAVEYGKFRQGIDCLKFGNSWVVTLEAMNREYGKSEYEINPNFTYDGKKSLIDNSEVNDIDEKLFKEVLSRNKIQKKKTK